jgi:hypothetical protein
MEIRVTHLVSVLIAAAALLTLGACGSAGARVAPATTVVVGQGDAGRTIEVKVGETVRVSLQDDYPVPGSSTVWNAISSNEEVLAPGTASRSTPTPSGLGRHAAYTADFSARAAGQAILDAHGITSCEAMVKQNCPDRDFKITVVVAS